jgi:hypothetical protein
MIFLLPVGGELERFDMFKKDIVKHTSISRNSKIIITVRIPQGIPAKAGGRTSIFDRRLNLSGRDYPVGSG